MAKSQIVTFEGYKIQGLCLPTQNTTVLMSPKKLSLPVLSFAYSSHWKVTETTFYISISCSFMNIDFLFFIFVPLAFTV